MASRVLPENFLEGNIRSGGAMDGKRKRKREENQADADERTHKYERSKHAVAPETKDKKLKGRISRTEQNVKDAISSAARSEILLPSEAGSLESRGTSKTYQIKQPQVGPRESIFRRLK